jgi:hypothetical protein
MKKWMVVVSAAIALAVLAVSPTVVLAKGNDNTTADMKPPLKGILAIDAPWRTRVGEKTTITVYERGSQDPVKDAGVWALSKENVLAIKEEIASLKQSSDRATVEAAVEKALNVRGIFLGKTNGAGKVQYNFERAGGYLLVAFKRGYFPGLRPIVVGPALTNTFGGQGLSSKG